MAIPLVVGIASAIRGALAVGVGAGGVALSVDAYNELWPRIKRRLLPDFQEMAMQAAMDKMGLQLDASQGLSDENLTAAINQGLLAGTGIQLDSVLDRDRLRSGLERLAVNRVGVELGFSGVNSIAGLRNELQSFLTEEVGRQLDVEGGVIFDAAIEAVKIAKAIREAPEPTVAWNMPTDFSDKGVQNRERQRRYRETHKRTWVRKSEL